MIFRFIKRALVNRSSQTKVKYLRKQGCKIGEGTRLLCNVGSFGSEPFLVEVGKDCLFSNNVSLFTHDGGVKVSNSLNYFDGKSMDKFGKIKIGNNCFVGNGVKILPGVIVGDNVIIGTGAIVTKNIPSCSVVAGIPARVICTIEEYYEKNKQIFFDTTGLSVQEKKKYILDNIK